MIVWERERDALHILVGFITKHTLSNGDAKALGCILENMCVDAQRSVYKFRIWLHCHSVELYTSLAWPRLYLYISSLRLLWIMFVSACCPIGSECCIPIPSPCNLSGGKTSKAP